MQISVAQELALFKILSEVVFSKNRIASQVEVTALNKFKLEIQMSLDVLEKIKQSNGKMYTEVEVA